MKSPILDSLGLGAIDIGLVLICLTAAILILLILLIVFISKEEKLRKRYERFMRGSVAKSLENDIGELYDDNRELLKITEENSKDIHNIYEKLEKTYQKTGIVKYDAYSQMGGALSFSLALLDEDNDGFVFNSIHSTEGCYTYIKEVKRGLARVELGEEEKKALNIAMEKA